MDTSLSVVIPAYKARFLEHALDSLAVQTDGEFDVHVGDDASPDDLSSIVSRYAGRLRIHFHRFPGNLGGTSLAGHWNRCVLNSVAPWVLLLGDDDMLDPGAVAAFRVTCEETRGAFDLYRFNTRRIDAEGHVIRINAEHPRVETSLEFLRDRFLVKRSSFTCEYVFSRAAFSRDGGFPDFPVGWCSDIAAWIRFAANTGIRTIPGPLASWRESSVNLSADTLSLRRAKVVAMSLYLEWLADQLGHGLTEEEEPPDLRALGVAWFFDRFWQWPSPLSLRDCVSIAGRLSKFERGARVRSLLRLLKHSVVPASSRDTARG